MHSLGVKGVSLKLVGTRIAAAITTFSPIQKLRS